MSKRHLGWLTKEELAAEEAAKARSKKRQWNTSRLAIVYTRQSTEVQTRRNREARGMQSVDLIDMALKYPYSWPEKNILPVDENLLDKFGNTLEKPRAASGRLDKNFRAGLRTAEELIEQDKVGAVFVRDIARLFRDPDQINPPAFAALCKQHHTVVITPDAEYDFNSKWDDLEDFLDEARDAAGYLKTLEKTMQRGRNRKGMRGDFAGHAIPVGHMLDERRKNYVPNPLWAPVVAWLTKRYRELDADLAALHNEIRGVPIFPELPDTIKERVGRIQLRPVPGGGYTVAGRASLIWMLINPCNIGHKMFNRHLIEDMHPAIVDRVDYDFALAHLGKADLDNNTIEREPRARRFTQGQKREGLLAGVRSDGRPVVGSNQGKCYIFQMGGYAAYTIKDTRSLANNPYSGSISLEVVDAAVSRRLEEILNDLTFDAEESGSLIASYQHSEVFNPGAQGWRDELVGKLVEQQQEKQASARAILDHVSSLRHQVRASLVRIDETCRDIEKAIAQEQREYDAARDVMSTEDISAHFAALARLRSRLADLREKQAQVAQTDQDIDTVKSRLTRTKDEWETMTLEQRRSFIRLITQTITLDALSDRWMKLTIEWSPVLAGGQYSEFALFLRSTGAGSNWTDEEDAILRDVYAGAARSDILVALPRRSWASCKSRAAALKITRQSREMGAFRLLENLALEDVSVMEEYGITQEQIWEGCTEWWGSGHMEGTLNSVGSPRTSINITASGQVGM